MHLYFVNTQLPIHFLFSASPFLLLFQYVGQSGVKPQTQLPVLLMLIFQVSATRPAGILTLTCKFQEYFP